MSEEIRINRPSMQNQESYNHHGQGSSKLPWVILAVVVIVIIVIGVLFRDKIFRASDKMEQKSGAPSGYQAVFLTNGQVYFGKMSDVRDSYITLKDIFYLQVQNPPIQGSQQQGNPPAGGQQQPQLSLVKLGQELHGPVDQMHINRDQVLFYEDMKEDAKVMQAIKEYKANPPVANPATGAGAGQQQTAPAPTQQQVPAPTKASAPSATPRAEQ